MTDKESSEKINELLQAINAPLVGIDKAVAVYCLHWLAAYTVGSVEGKAGRAVVVEAAEAGANYGYSCGVMAGAGSATRH